MHRRVIEGVQKKRKGVWGRGLLCGRVGWMQDQEEQAMSGAVEYRRRRPLDG